MDPSCIGKNIPVDVPIVGDAKYVLQGTNRLVGFADIGPWIELVRTGKAAILRGGTR